MPKAPELWRKRIPAAAVASAKVIAPVAGAGEAEKTDVLARGSAARETSAAPNRIEAGIERW